MDRISRIEKVAAEFYVRLDPNLFPYSKMKVRVLERFDHGFLAISNLHRFDSATGNTEYLSGLGETVEVAMEDLLTRYVADAKEHQPENGYAESDFVWSAAEDF